MLPYKFSTTSGNVTRFFAVFILALLLASFFMINSVVKIQLTAKRDVIADTARAIQRRIDVYRFNTWQIYENLVTNSTGPLNSEVKEVRLLRDVHYVDSTRYKIKALIFGPHDTSTLDKAYKISGYLNTIWGSQSRDNIWSMYLLNDLDNSLIMASNLPLKDMAMRYNAKGINDLAEARRTEMLQQANALDERESFSPLRRFSSNNSSYFTLLTTFNQPGHLASVIAFDIPINNLLPFNMKSEDFQLRQDFIVLNRGNVFTNNDDNENSRISFVSPDIEISSSLTKTSLKLVYRTTLSRLIADTLLALFWPLLANFVLLILLLTGWYLLRQHALRPNDNNNPELESIRLLNQEIVASLPLGLLVYDFSTNRTIISNKIAQHLLPHLNLVKIINMSEKHQGILQVTVNNQVYEVRHFRCMISPQTQLFLMRDQDRELLVDRTLQRAKQILEKNHQTRQQLMQHLGCALQKPLSQLVNKLKERPETPAKEALSEMLESSKALSRLVDDIILLNRLELDDWSSETASFNLQDLLDKLTLELIPSLQRKGLRLVIDNHLPYDEIRSGDQQLVSKLLSTLLHYAITTTPWGRIALQVTAPAGRDDRLSITITDTGLGLNRDELRNADFPFLEKTSYDRFGETSGLALFLCKQLCKQLGGQLEIQTHPDIGTRYLILLYAPLEHHQKQEGKLLDDVTILIKVAVDDIRKIVERQLKQWGAICITPEEYFSGQQHDILMTDDPQKLTNWSLLLTDDEPGFRPLAKGQFRVNFNISKAVQDALLQLIEQQLSESETDCQEGTQDHVPEGYFPLFVDTVPDDVKKLYNEAANKDYNSLAQTAHRLKGVFAMLNLLPGKQLCESLEQHIKICDDSNIKNTTSDIELYINELLQQGNK